MKIDGDLLDLNNKEYLEMVHMKDMRIRVHKEYIKSLEHVIEDQKELIKSLLKKYTILCYFLIFIAILNLTIDLIEVWVKL